MTDPYPGLVDGDGCAALAVEGQPVEARIHDPVEIEHRAAGGAGPEDGRVGGIVADDVDILLTGQSQRAGDAISAGREVQRRIMRAKGVEGLLEGCRVVGDAVPDGAVIRLHIGPAREWSDEFLIADRMRGDGQRRRGGGKHGGAQALRRTWFHASCSNLFK